MDTMNATRTEQVIYEMLTKNTGRHMLDSGGAYGRHWEKNQGLTLEALKSAPAMTLDTKWGDATLNVFHWLSSQLEYEAEENEAFYEWAGGRDGHWLELMEEYCQLNGAGENGWGANSYNYDSMLSQVIQYQTFEREGTVYMLLQIHGGADVRGGYTAPRVFSYDPYSFFEYGAIYCSGDAVDSDGPHRIEWSGGEWVYEGEYSSEYSPYAMTERRDLLKLDYLPCPICGAAMVEAGTL